VTVTVRELEEGGNKELLSKED